MTLFKAPLAYNNKDAVFQGMGAFCMPRLETEDVQTDYAVSQARRQRRKAGFISSVLILVPPVPLPSFRIPLPPCYEEDKSIDELERDLEALRAERKSDRAQEEWRREAAVRKSVLSIDPATMERHAGIALKESGTIRDRIAGIRALRRQEEEEKRKALVEAARKADEARRARGKEEQGKFTGQVKAEEQARSTDNVPARRVEVAEAEIGSYEQNPEDYEKPVTLDRARGIMRESLRIMDSVALISKSVDPAVKTKRMQYKMLINRRVGQVANSSSQVFLVIKELLKLAAEVWKGDGNDMLNYCAYIMATKFVEQAETQIALHAPSAFPYGQTAADLIGIVPPFRIILMALLFEKCPYVIPRYPPRRSRQSEEEHKRALGYKPGEGEASYSERMSGLVAFYAAIIQSIPLRPGVVNPYDVKFAWLWLASIMNMRPRPITPYVVTSFLEIAGYRMSQVFGPNFMSLMEYTNTTFIPMIPSVSTAAKTRLKIYVEDVHRRGKVQVPEGLSIEGAISTRRGSSDLGGQPQQSQSRSTLQPARRGSSDLGSQPQQSQYRNNQRPARGEAPPAPPPAPSGRPVFPPMKPNSKGKGGGKNRW